MFDELNDKSTIVTFTKNVNIINELKIKMFLNNDIFELKNIVFNIDKNITIIDNCQNFIILFIVINCNFLMKRLTKILDNFKISINFIITI